MNHQKTRKSLTLTDAKEHPVWHCASDAIDFERIFSVDGLPAAPSDDLLVVSQVTFADGEQNWAQLWDFRFNDLKWSAVFLTAAFHNRGQWFRMARSHDFGQDKFGPKAVSEFLGRRLNDIFPIQYDVTPFFSIQTPSMKGRIYPATDPLKGPSLNEITDQVIKEGVERANRLGLIKRWGLPRSRIKHLNA